MCIGFEGGGRRSGAGRARRGAGGGTRDILNTGRGQGRARLPGSIVGQVSSHTGLGWRARLNVPTSFGKKGAVTGDPGGLRWQRFVRGQPELGKG